MDIVGSRVLVIEMEPSVAEFSEPEGIVEKMELLDIGEVVKTMSVAVELLAMVLVMLAVVELER